MQTNRARHWFCAVAASLWMWLLIVYAVIVLAATANAQPVTPETAKHFLHQHHDGLDLLGLAKMNVKTIIEEIDDDTAIGTLAYTFGDIYAPLGQLLDSGKVGAYRVHLRDFTCYRGGRCPSGYPSQADRSAIAKAARALHLFAVRYPTIPCFVSPALEHDVKDKATVIAWFKTLREIVPECRMVCSAFTGFCPKEIRYVKGDQTTVYPILTEKHGNTGQADIRSNDGASLFDGNTTEFRQSARVLALGWDYSFNGRTSGEKVFAPPLSRRDFADREILRQAVRVMRPATRAADFAGCSVIRKPELGKTNAEYYGKGKDDGRGNKFLFISKNRIGERLRIETLRGKEVGCLKYFGPFSGGGYRYYVGNCSGQSPTRLMDLLGSEWGIIRWKGGCRLFSPIRRTGYFH